MKKKGINVRSHPVGNITVLLLIALFVVMCLLTVLLSVRSYAGITEDLGVDSDARLIQGYLASKLRAGDTEGAVTVKDMDGVTVLSIATDGLENLIYVYDGKLCEQLWDAADPFDVTLGESLVDAQAMTVTPEDGLIRIDVTDGTGVHRQTVCALHSMGGVSP